MSFRPCCIICCSDCGNDGFFTSCQHFICSRCAARYPPGQCPRCRKPCKAVKAGPTLPKEVSDRVSQNPQHLMQLAAQTLDFQRRQEQQSLQRLRELVTTLNQSNRNMASQISAAKVEREKLLSAIKGLQSQLYVQQRQQSKQQQQQQQLCGSQRLAGASVIASSGGDCSGTVYNGNGSGSVKRSTPLHGTAPLFFANNVPAARGWLSSSPGCNGAAETFTPLGWGQSKRKRVEDSQTPTRNEQTHFHLATPAITLRNAPSGPCEVSLGTHMDSGGAVRPPKPLRSLLCRDP